MDFNRGLPIPQDAAIMANPRQSAEVHEASSSDRRFFPDNSTKMGNDNSPLLKRQKCRTPTRSRELTRRLIVLDVDLMLVSLARIHLADDVVTVYVSYWSRYRD